MCEGYSKQYVDDVGNQDVKEWTFVILLGLQSKNSAGFAVVQIKRKLLIFLINCVM